MQIEPSNQTSSSWLNVVADQVADLRFGVVRIVVHDSPVVQIERTQKSRIAPEDQPRGTIKLS